MIEARTLNVTRALPLYWLILRVTYWMVTPTWTRQARTVHGIYSFCRKKRSEHWQIEILVSALKCSTPNLTESSSHCNGWVKNVLLIAMTEPTRINLHQAPHICTGLLNLKGSLRPQQWVNILRSYSFLNRGADPTEQQSAVAPIPSCQCAMTRK